MYCKFCKQEIAENANFCPVCGKKTNELYESADTSAPSVQPIPVTIYTVEREKANIFALLAVIFGALSTTIFLGFFFLLPAIIMCVLAIIKRKTLGSRMLRPAIIWTAIPTSIFAFFFTIVIISAIFYTGA